jgi:hypothetical protein
MERVGILPLPKLVEIPVNWLYSIPYLEKEE